MRGQTVSNLPPCTRQITLWFQYLHNPSNMPEGPVLNQLAWAEVSCCLRRCECSNLHSERKRACNQFSQLGSSQRERFTEERKLKNECVYFHLSLQLPYDDGPWLFNSRWWWPSGRNLPSNFPTGKQSYAKREIKHPPGQSRPNYFVPVFCQNTLNKPTTGRIVNRQKEESFYFHGIRRQWRLLRH